MEIAKHIPVLLKESIEGLSIKKGDVVVDGTFGGGGHSKEIYENFPDIKKLICIDLDEDAKNRYEDIFKNKTHIDFILDNFKNSEQILLKAKSSVVDKVILDLGTSTFQLLNDTRGFSFNSDTALSMSFSKNGSHTGFSAYDIVNSWGEDSIADIIFFYGEEKKAKLIAKAIVNSRKNTPIKKSSELASIIETVIKKRGKIHPATKTFQALRITVNDELQVIEQALDAWWRVLNKNGRIAVITFHSLEDRIVKRWMKKQTNERVITKKPIIPTAIELKINKRSRSAKLRIIEKI